MRSTIGCNASPNEMVRTHAGDDTVQWCKYVDEHGHDTGATPRHPFLPTHVTRMPARGAKTVFSVVDALE